MTFAEANKVVHPVETQWHYKHLVPYGFVALTKEGIGFVRSYKYEHSDGRKVECTTGCNADYWKAYSDWDNLKEVDGGYWSSLETYGKGGI